MDIIKSFIFCNLKSKHAHILFLSRFYTELSVLILLCTFIWDYLAFEPSHFISATSVTERIFLKIWQYLCFFFSVFSMIHYKCLSGCCHHCGAAVANRSFMWVDILTHSCMWVQEMLHVRSFFVSLIKAVASEQLAEILFFRYNWLVGCVLQICMVSSLLMRC